MSIAPADLLAELVAIPSVNPMGRDLDGPEYFEARLTDYLQELFQRYDLPWHRQTVAPRRDNILARIDGSRSPSEGGKLLLLEAHQDTVPVDGMTIDPFDPRIEGGKIYGRGSCDIKGGMAAMLTAFLRLAEERPEGMPTVVMACSVNEEFGFTGATAMAELWHGGKRTFFAKPPDGAIVAEPTDLNVVVAHKGVLRWRCHARGRAAHTSQPQRGVNAIYKMVPVIEAVERYHREEIPRLAEHPLCGRPTVCVSMIQGGISVNTVPDRVTIDIDRRLTPGEDAKQAYAKLVDFLNRNAGGQPEIQHEEPYSISPGLSDAGNGAWADRLISIVREQVPECRKTGVAYGTDASAFDAAGVPSVVFGPGSIDQAHTADEWLELSQLEQAAELYYRIAREAFRDG
jgi:acetylornithine deacetylase